MSLPHNRLDDLVDYLGIERRPRHRALGDVEMTVDLYEILKGKLAEKGETLSFTAKSHSGPVMCHKTKLHFDPATLVPDPDSEIYGNEFVFTGALERMTRNDALKVVEALGGLPGGNVRKSTNYLVVADAEFPSSVVDGKSGKIKRAEELIMKGADLKIVSEGTFMSMLDW